MNERRRPPRRGRGQRPQDRPATEGTGEPNPYRDEPIHSNSVDAPSSNIDAGDEQPAPRAVTTTVNTERQRPTESDTAAENRPPVPAPRDADDSAPGAGGDDLVESRRETARPENHPRSDNGSVDDGAPSTTTMNGSTAQPISQGYGQQSNQPRHDGGYPPREHRNGRRR